MSGPPCPSDLRFDAFDAGELSAADETALRAHCEGCTDCLGRMQALAERRAAFEADPALKALGRRLVPEPPRPRVPWWRVMAPVAAAVAAAVALVVWLPGGPPDDGVRLKGGGDGLVLEVHRRVPGGSEPLGDGALLRPGEALGFRVRSDRPGRLALWVRDGAGAVQALVPAGMEAPRVGEGARDLGVAVAVDATPGPTRFHVVRCAGPPAAPLLAAAAARLAGPDGLQPDGLAPSLPAGCVATSAGVVVQ